ncbi:MAG: TonB family protein [Phenylobacterium sp.]|uniref:TonB family protein n=1 Tax=Phenylobacterium sp. TaxID=1871053 RepID=UPI001A6225D5|nr:TonB family protein [Phenylobacterium sp.]MBL8555630.1 TonB family protein [Phenylobacterium sp.]
MALLAAPALAQPKPSVITAPDWAALPTAQTLAENYPKVGLLLQVEGYAVIACPVTERGALVDCTVDGEAPRNMGFGAAAIRMSRVFQMKPQTVDGKATSGGTVRIPIRFTLPAIEPEGKPPAKAATALALQIVDTMEATQTFVSAMDAQIAEINADSTAPQTSRAAAMAVLRTAAASRREDMRQALAATLAANYSLEDLTRITSFLKSPAGQVLRGGDALKASVEALTPQVGPVVMTELHNAVCARLPCRPSAEALRIIDAPGATPDGAWLKMPTAAAIADEGPAIARVMGVEGAVRLTCENDLTGQLVGCKVDAEAPAGWDFGTSALALASTYRMPPGPAKPRVLRIAFAAPSYEKPQRSPRTAPGGIAAARALIDTFDPMAQLSTQLEPQLKVLGVTVAATRNDAEAKALTEAMRVAIQNVIAYFLDEAANALATHYAQQDLAEAARFMDSPVGRSLMKPQRVDDVPAVARVSATIAAEAREVYCKNNDCSPPPPRPGAAR